MKATTEKTFELTLVLEQQEAEFLLAAMQNPIPGEIGWSATMRTELFKAIDCAIRNSKGPGHPLV